MENKIHPSPNKSILLFQNSLNNNFCSLIALAFNEFQCISQNNFSRKEVREGGRKDRRKEGEERKGERKKKEGKKMELRLYMGQSFHPHILHEDKTHISKSMPLV